MTNTVKLGLLATQLMILENETPASIADEKWLEENKRLVSGQIKILEMKMDRERERERNTSEAITQTIVQCKDCKFGYNGDMSCEIKHFFGPDGFCSKAKPNIGEEPYKIISISHYPEDLTNDSQTEV